MTTTTLQRRRSAICLGLLAAAVSAAAHAQSPVTTCDVAGIGAAKLDAEGSPVTVLDVSAAKAGNVDYCLVKLQVPQAINIWVGLPMAGAWNGRWQSTGGGGYAGMATAPNQALVAGYAAASTDTGHKAQDGGKFGMLEPGKPNVELQKDFAYRSEHLMAVLGKQLVQAFYGKKPEYSYWNGCSTGGRQGLRMAQDYPDDYDGILAGAPAIHWDRFQAQQIWPQVAQLRDNGGLIGGGARELITAKQQLATSKAIAACDALDGVSDGVLTDPRKCKYSAAKDTSITTAACTATDASCLTPTEASAIDKMWQGPVACANGSGSCDVPQTASRDAKAAGNKRLWYGMTRGTALGSLGGAIPFSIAVEQPRYWVYFNADWDWKTLDYANFQNFFNDTVAKVGPVMGSDNPDLSKFRDHGGKLVLYHGWSDMLIMPEGTIDYYERVTNKLGGGYSKTQQFARLFMAPGVGHCAGGDGPQPQGMFEAVVDWVEHGKAPETILSTKKIDTGTRTRPLCQYPEQAVWNGKGSSDDAANFSCAVVK
ncbi:MAG TPA: tannase/feruloyl esterase family alpha/beta hydrolase [Candidatus Acidoferrum sp.]|nr:tannase/feruloyl esterase family alpha/beta hydrolase [Candidatus Acidoferrum sp.]